MNSDIIHHKCRGDSLTTAYKEQIVVSEDLKKYPGNDRNKTVLALCWNKRDDLWEQRDLVIKHCFTKK